MNSVLQAARGRPPHPELGTNILYVRSPRLLAELALSRGDLPMLALDAIRAQAYLKAPAAMWQLFGNQLPASWKRHSRLLSAASSDCARRTQPACRALRSRRFFGLQPPETWSSSSSASWSRHR